MLIKSYNILLDLIFGSCNNKFKNFSNVLVRFSKNCSLNLSPPILFFLGIGGITLDVNILTKVCLNHSKSEYLLITFKFNKGTEISYV